MSESKGISLAEIDALKKQFDSGRNFFLALREWAEVTAYTPGLNEHWALAYVDLARAADRLDAMWARSSVGVPAITISVTPENVAAVEQAKKDFEKYLTELKGIPHDPSADHLKE